MVVFSLNQCQPDEDHQLNSQEDPQQLDHSPEHLLQLLQLALFLLQVPPSDLQLLDAMGGQFSILLTCGGMISQQSDPPTF